MKTIIIALSFFIFVLTSNGQEKTSGLRNYYNLNGYGLKVPFGANPIKTDPLENEAMTSVEFRYFPEKDVNSAYAIAILNSKQLNKIEDSIRELEYFAKVVKYTAETVMKGEMLIDMQSTYKNRLCYNQKFKYKDQETKEEVIMTNVLFYYKTNIIRAYVVSTIKNDNNSKINTFFENIILQDEVINTDNNDEDIYRIMPIMPQFGDTKEALQEYIKKNSKLPTSIAKTPTTKNVFVKVLIEKDGKVKFDKIMRGVSEKCDAEAKRIVENMTNWTPGQFENGKKGRVSIMFPIWFE